MRLISKMAGKGGSSVICAAAGTTGTGDAPGATAALLKSLSQALTRQCAWKPAHYLNTVKQGCEISGVERDGMVHWLAQLTRQFKFYPETFALSVAVLDRFLHTVKARVKYLRCIAVSCFYLAAKTSEEDEVVPGTLELVRESGCGCTVSEVLRMEKCILDKLSWQVRYVTHIDFLHIVHALLMSKNPELLGAYPSVTPSRQLALVTSRLQQAVCHAALVTYSPATLATAAMSIELEQFNINWLPLTLWMQALTQVEMESLIRCRETMCHVLGSGPPSRGPYTPASAKPTKRKMDNEEDDNIYDGIKRLYNDENAASNATSNTSNATSCALEARIEAPAPAPSCALIAN